MSSQVTRRGFLRGGLALGVGGTALPALLDACGSAASTAGSAGAAALPTYVAPKVPAAQLPGNTAGVQNCYWQMPSNLVQTVKSPPGNGGTVTSMQITYNSPPTPVSQNAYWQELNKRLGVNYQPSIVSASDYPDKMATTMASNDLPDLLMLFTSPAHVLSAVPGVGQFLQYKCEDLTPYLSGDAVKAYPNLAALGDVNWNACAYNGRIYTLPTPQGAWWEGMFILQDLADQAGISQPKSADEFKRLMTELNRPKQGRWAMGGQTGFSYNLNFFFSMFGVPNHWAVDKSGKFTADLETEAAKEAVAYVRDLYQAGLFHPQAGSMTTVQAKDAFYAAQICSYQDGFGAYTGLQTNTASTSGHTVGVVVPPGHNGGPGKFYFATPSWANTCIPKASRSKVEELLRIANYFAAPFGSEEYLFLNYGVEGIDYTRDAQGNPIQTTKGKNEVNLAVNFVAEPQGVVFTPGQPNYAKAVYNSEKALVRIGIPNPTADLFSPTFARAGSTLLTNLNDGASAIIAGREPLSYWKTVVDQWRSQGGNQIRKEYQQAYAKTKGGSKQ